jgi:hypothetical protein
MAVIAGARLALASAPATLPKDAHVCIRLAAVLVGTEAEGADNRLEMRVEAASFLGDAVRLTLRGEGPEVMADVPFARLGRVPGRGDTMTVALPAAQLMVLPGGR